MEEGQKGQTPNCSWKNSASSRVAKINSKDRLLLSEGDGDGVGCPRSNLG